jgi:proteasome lid subunit RPN8/RPN11
MARPSNIRLVRDQSNSRVPCCVFILAVYLPLSTRAKLTNVPKSLRVPREIRDALLTDARAHAPNESCGLLSGRDSAITKFHPTQNASPTPKSNYEIAPTDLFQIMREIRKQNLELLAIYHSHPTTENMPSPTDIARAYYPEAAYIIVSPRSQTTVRAFQIRDSQVTELAIEILEDEI